MKTSDYLIGLALVILGILFLIDNFGFVNFDFSRLWPVIVIFVGAGFWIGFYKNREEFGLIIPGTIFLLFGLLFLYCTVFNQWDIIGRGLWPLFILGPGLGFILIYLLAKRDAGFLIPGLILSGLAFLFLLIFNNIFSYWPLFLIATGVYLVYTYLRSRNE
jgi:hypothetical protein